jgi:hypothetical protein
MKLDKKIDLSVPAELLFDLNNDNAQDFVLAVNDFFNDEKKHCCFSKSNKGLYLVDVQNPRTFDHAYRLGKDQVALQCSSKDYLCHYLKFENRPRFAFLDKSRMYVSQGFSRDTSFTGRHEHLYIIE